MAGAGARAALREPLVERARCRAWLRARLAALAGWLAHPPTHPLASPSPALPCPAYPAAHQHDRSGGVELPRGDGAGQPGPPGGGVRLPSGHSGCRHRRRPAGQRAGRQAVWADVLRAGWQKGARRRARWLAACARPPRLLRGAALAVPWLAPARPGIAWPLPQSVDLPVLLAAPSDTAFNGWVGGWVGGTGMDVSCAALRCAVLCCAVLGLSAWQVLL